jgi:hypothetical protein
MFSTWVNLAEMEPVTMPLDIIVAAGHVAVHLLVEKVDYEPE